MNKNVLAAILGVLLALSIGGNAWFYSKSSKDQKAVQDLASIQVLNDSLQREIQKMDSLQNLLASTQGENIRLAGRVDELEAGGGQNNNAEIQQLRNKIAYYQKLVSQGGAAVANVASSGKISKEDAKKLSELKAELDAKLKEIEELNKRIAELTSERDGAIADRDAAVERKASLESENVDLKDRIARGAYPQYGTLLSTGIEKKNDQQLETIKAKSIERFKITFDVLDNPLIREPMEEEVTIRIIGPEGEVLSTNNATLVDKSKVYSLKQTIISDGEMHKVKWYYPPSGNLSAKLKKGKYTTELWSRGLLRQKNTFELN